MQLKMLDLLSKAGRDFLRTFGGALLVVAPGVLAAPNFDGALTLATAALIGAVSAGIAAVQPLVPQLSFGGRFPYGYALDAALRAGVGGLIVTALGVLAAPNLAEAKAVWTAGLIAIATGIIRAVQGAVMPGPPSVPATGAN